MYSIAFPSPATMSIYLAILRLDRRRHALKYRTVKWISKSGRVRGRSARRLLRRLHRRAPRDQRLALGAQRCRRRKRRRAVRPQTRPDLEIYFTVRYFKASTVEP